MPARFVKFDGGLTLKFIEVQGYGVASVSKLVTTRDRQERNLSREERSRALCLH